VSASSIELYGDDYCVIDMHNLFVGTTADDELLLLGAAPGTDRRLAEECSRFGVQMDGGRKLASYSGGEQAMIGCLLMMLLLPQAPLRILLVHVMETLSPRNREALALRFAQLLPEASLFTLAPDGPQPLAEYA